MMSYFMKYFVLCCHFFGLWQSPGGPGETPLNFRHVPIILSPSLLSDTMKRSRLILCSPCPSLSISHFCKKDGFLTPKLRNQDVLIVTGVSLHPDPSRGQNYKIHAALSYICIHTCPQSHLFPCWPVEIRYYEFTLVPFLLSHDHRLHSGFFPFTSTVRNLASNILLYLFLDQPLTGSHPSPPTARHSSWWGCTTLLARALTAVLTTLLSLTFHWETSAAHTAGTPSPHLTSWLRN